MARQSFQLLQVEAGDSGLSKKMMQIGIFRCLENGATLSDRRKNDGNESILPFL